MNVESNRVTNQFSNEEEEEEREAKTITAKVSKFHGWHSNGNNDNSSRIFRVSRATGGKDRHSKVLTSKGLRDRRVRLSVSTAIAFYDLQDRLGYDQPSKAVEWLIKASEEAISELPVLTTPFSTESPSFLKKQQQFNNNGVDTEMDRDNLNNPNSSLSLSRPDEIRVNRVKARERAREIRVAKEREKENEMRIGDLVPNQTLVSQNNASFTELLTNGLLFSTTQSMIMSPFSTATTGDNHNHHQHHHSQQHDHQQQQQQHFTNDMQDYDLNFRMSSSSSSGFNNRGTLQSNLSVPSLFTPHNQFTTRFSSEDGSSNNNNNNSNIPFFFGAMAAAPTSSVSSENNNSGHHQHHNLQQDHYSQFDAGFDGRLQLFHGDGTPHSDHKGKRKN